MTNDRASAAEAQLQSQVMTLQQQLDRETSRRCVHACVCMCVRVHYAAVTRDEPAGGVIARMGG